LYHNVLRPTRISVPVISVGNITCGGTGKTPVVISVAQYLMGAGAKVCVISRGYRKRAGDSLTVVSDGQGNFADCNAAGDEALLVAHSVPKAIVLAGSDRVQACNLAIERFGCQVIVLDDAFQHYPLYRQLDIVLLDYNDDLMKDSLLPSGRLREPIQQLKRAGEIVITKLPSNYNHSKLRRLKATAVNLASHASFSTCRLVSRGVTAVPFGPLAPVRSIKNHTVVAFCGLARPDGFFSLLKEQGIKVAAEKAFPDHHWYTQGDLATLRHLKKAHDATLLITTQKDAVKLANLGNTDDVLALAVEIEWLEGVPSGLKDVVSNLQNTSDAGLALAGAQAPVRI
jgi:tetraacyldisaccharide 4'-kinase